MARFYGSMVNKRGNEVTAEGSKDGQQAHLRGWNSGVRVVARAVGDSDHFEIYKTSGSNGGRSDKLLAVVKDDTVEVAPHAEDPGQDD